MQVFRKKAKWQFLFRLFVTMPSERDEIETIAIQSTKRSTTTSVPDGPSFCERSTEVHKDEPDLGRDDINTDLFKAALKRLPFDTAIM